MIGNQQPHTSQVFMATDTHNYQTLISISLLRHHDLFRFSYGLCNVLQFYQLANKRSTNCVVTATLQCEYFCNSACLQIAIVLSEQEWVENNKKLSCFIISWQSKAWLGVIIFPDAMHTRRSNQAITMLHCNVSIMLLIEITSQPQTPPQHTPPPPCWDSPFSCLPAPRKLHNILDISRKYKEGVIIFRFLPKWRWGSGWG